MMTTWPPLKSGQYSIVHWKLGMPHRWMKLFILASTFLYDLLDLLLYFKSNSHVFMADIRKAFLMIKLKSGVDKNRFCFFFFFFFFFLLERVKMLCAFDTQHLFLDLWRVHSFKIFLSNSTGISTEAMSAQGIFNESDLLCILGVFISSLNIVGK